MDLDELYALGVAIGGRVMAAIAIFLVGIHLVKLLMRLVSASFERHQVDASLRSFSLSLIRAGGYIILGITIASTLGIEMTSVLALLASAGLAVGLALQGSLSNFAGGVLLLALKPFRVGDYIEGAGQAGTVNAIQIFYTTLVTPDNRKIIIPNADLANSNTVNYSANPTRRLDLVFSAGYEDDVDFVKGILEGAVAEQTEVLSDPPPQIVVGEHGANSINYFVRVWVKREDYWPLRFALLELVKKEFDKAGINIPYPQVDVHMKN